eukprot:212223_1
MKNMNNNDENHNAKDISDILIIDVVDGSSKTNAYAKKDGIILYMTDHYIIYVSLKCPLSGCKIKTPIRGSNCLHPQCIDLKTFVISSHKSGTWQCPVCLKPLTLNQIFIDHKMSS